MKREIKAEYVEELIDMFQDRRFRVLVDSIGTKVKFDNAKGRPGLKCGDFHFYARNDDGIAIYRFGKKKSCVVYTMEDVGDAIKMMEQLNESK